MFIINFNGIVNGFRSRTSNASEQVHDPISAREDGAFSPPYAVPANLISGTSWTSTRNGFHLTSHLDLNNSDVIHSVPRQIGTTKNVKYYAEGVENIREKDDPNKIVEIVESDESPPYLPSTAITGLHQRPTTVTPQSSPTAPALSQGPTDICMGSDGGSSVTQVDLHHPTPQPFQYNSQDEQDLAC